MAKRETPKTSTPRKKKVDVMKCLVIHMISEGPSVGWVHTHGMREFGHPELEIRCLPKFMMMYGGSLLNELGSFILNSGEVFKTGEVVQLGISKFRLSRGEPNPADPDEAAHYQEEVWRLIDVEDAPCAVCNPHPSPQLN